MANETKETETLELEFLPAEWFTDRESVREFLRGDRGFEMLDSIHWALGRFAETGSGHFVETYDGENSDAGHAAFNIFVDLQKLIAVALGDPDRSLILKDDTGSICLPATAVKWIHELLLCCHERRPTALRELHAYYLNQLTDDDELEVSAATAPDGGAA